jgi:3-isopropylmalate dehydrogenase
MRYTIAVLPGDGIGPEIIEQTVKVVDAVCSKGGHQVDYVFAAVGAAAIDQCGDPYPPETHETCMKADAVLFGAIGDPRFDKDPGARVRPETGLLRMRQQLGLYANIRPVTVFPPLISKSPLRKELLSGVDFLAVRELTGGIYFGTPRGRSEDGETAYDTCVYHRYEIERVSEMAFRFAMQRKKKLCMVDKANVLATSRLWREVVQQKAKEYPEVDTEYMFVDNAAMQIIQNPGRFDVMLTENMFGDILTDEASVITGSLGLLPSASMGLHTPVFEPIHGSYPQAAGKNIANPLATVLSAAMLFELAFHLENEAAWIRKAVITSLEAGKMTEDLDSIHPSSTSAVGDWLADYILQL